MEWFAEKIVFKSLFSYSNLKSFIIFLCLFGPRLLHLIHYLMLHLTLQQDVSLPLLEGKPKKSKSNFNTLYFNVKSSFGINEDVQLSAKINNFIYMNSNYLLIEIFCCIDSKFDPGNTPNQIYPSLAINEMCNYITACCCHLENWYFVTNKLSPYSLSS